jgi:hypothetical protein
VQISGQKSATEGREEKTLSPRSLEEHEKIRVGGLF